MATRLPTNQKDREVYLCEHGVARFIEVVRDARRNRVATILMTVKAFAGEPELLYVALDYAYHEGIGVTMVPAEGDEPSMPCVSS
jgi:hypothetical protein